MGCPWSRVSVPYISSTSCSFQDTQLSSMWISEKDLIFFYDISLTSHTRDRTYYHGDVWLESDFEEK